MLFRLGVLPVIAALMLCMPHVAQACGAQTGLVLQEHSAAIEDRSLNLPEQIAAQPASDTAEPVAFVPPLAQDDLDAFDASRFAGSNDEIVALIAASFSADTDTETTGSVSPNPVTEWALDGFEDR